MTFESFLKIFDYTTFDLLMSDKAEVYRKAFSLGKGIVCLENILTVLNEDGWFCRLVDKIFEKVPVIR